MHNIIVGGRTIHLSYHDGDHYSSVRSIGEPDTGVPRAVDLKVQAVHIFRSNFSAV